jgi:hypothetical protein
MNRGGITPKQSERIVAALSDTTQRLPEIAAAEGLSVGTIRNMAELHKITTRGRM